MERRSVRFVFVTSIFVTLLLPPAPTSAALATCGAQPVTITVNKDGAPIGDGRDVIVGTKAMDVINALGGNDEINGGGGNDLICGSDGLDTINGGGGYDYLEGGLNDDTISGGPGGAVIFGGTTGGFESGDTATYAGAPYKDKPNDIDLRVNMATATTDWGEDTLDGIENIIGTKGDDVIIGNDFAGTGNALYGLGGKDLIYGWNGDDLLEGGSGDDDLVPGLGNDTVDGGKNGDVEPSPEHAGDVVWYDEFTTGFLSLSLTDSNTTLGTQTDLLVRMESAVGGGDSSQMVGDEGPNLIQGTEGIDLMIGGTGNDEMHGLGGNDSLNGQGGIDPAYAGNGSDSCDSMRILAASSCEFKSDKD